MKELDFLPDWYRADRQRKHRRQRHYVLFGLVVALLAGWSFFVGQSVRGLQADTRTVEATLEQGMQTIQTAQEMESEIERLSRQAETLAVLTPRTPVSAVLGELSACVSDQIILGRVSLVQEPVIDNNAKTSPAANGVIRLGAARADVPTTAPEGPQRTRVILTGIAAGGADVARLIDRLETSGYFETISPGFSRAKKVGDREVTEFEITCGVADYKIQR
jgi:hypothetical protein